MSDLEVELQRLASVTERQAAEIISLRTELIDVERRLRDLDERARAAPVAALAAAATAALEAPPVRSHERVGGDWKRRPRKPLVKAKPKRKGASR